MDSVGQSASVYIHQHSMIRNQTLWRNGKQIFQEQRLGLDHFLKSAEEFLACGYPKYYKMDRLAKLGFLASEVLLQQNAILKSIVPTEVAIVLANAHASLDTDARYQTSTNSIPSPSLFVYTLANVVAGEICIRHGFKGENAFFILPEFDAATLVQYVDMVLNQTTTQVCVAGWIDVLDEHHDVFLYLASKQPGASVVEHSITNVQKLYHADYGTVEGGS